MPKKVWVMCFFLPQVHRRKAQAQFPSFNRVARFRFFLCIFFFKSFFVLFKKMSQCKKQVGWPPARFEQLTLDVCVFICEVWKYQSCCCFSSFSSVLGRQEGSRCSLFRGQNLCRQQQQLAYNQYMRLNKISTEFKVNTVCFKCLKISNRSMLQPLVPCSCHITRNTRVKIKRLGRQSESRLEIWTRDLLTQSKTPTLMGHVQVIVRSEMGPCGREQE